MNGSDLLLHQANETIAGFQRMIQEGELMVPRQCGKP
jgi:hypothetical protein